MKTSSNLPSRSRQLLRREAFTLIELLVVISIIAVLAGLLLPVVNKVTESAKKTAAKSALTQVATAVNNFQTDYGKYPVYPTDIATPNDYTFGYDGHNDRLFQALRALTPVGSDTDLNPRRVVYFEGKNVKNPQSPRDGFIQTAGGKSSGGLGSGAITLRVGDMMDPWGNCYIVRIDSNYTNAVQNPYQDKIVGSAYVCDTMPVPSGQEADVVRVGAIGLSLGLDGKLGPNGATVASPYTAIGDDVVSWQ